MSNLEEGEPITEPLEESVAINVPRVYTRIKVEMRPERTNKGNEI